MASGRAKQIFTILSTMAMLGASGSISAHAQNITIQGKVTDSSGNAVNGAATLFRVQIYSPDAANHCILYDETHTVDLSISYGLFSINLGVVDPLRVTRQAPTTYSLEQVISNRTSLSVPGTFCSPAVAGTATYTPAFDDNRKVLIQFRDPNTMPGWETIPEMDLNPVAYAIDSRNLGGFPASTVLRVVNGLGVPAATGALTTAEVAELHALAGGVSTKYVAHDASSGVKVPTGAPTAPAAGSIWFSGGNLQFSDGSTVHTLGTSGAGSISSITAGDGLSGGGNTGAVTVDLETLSPSPAGTVGSGTAIPVLTIDQHGRVITAGSTAISGTLPSGTSGHFLRSNGSAWSSQAIRMTDIKNAAGTANLFSSPNCTSSQSLYWDSGADEIRCQNIGGLDAGAISAGTLADARLANVGTAGTYAKVTTDAKGRVTAGAALTATDIPALDWTKITTGTPTTLAGYGITDALRNADGSVPSISSGTEAALPAPIAGNVNHLYIANDTKKIFRQIAGTWEVIGAAPGAGFTGSLAGEISGTQGATQVSSINGISRADITTHLNSVAAATNANTASAIVKRDASGNIAAGAASLGAVVLRDSGANTATIQAPTTISSSYTLRLPAAVGAANQVLTTDASGNLSWSTPAAAGSVTVTPPITNSGTASAPNIGISQASGSQNGYLSSADWTTFSNKLGSALNSALIWVGNGSNVATPVAPSGDVAMTNAGAFTVNGLRGQAISAQGSTAGQMLRYAGTNTWTPAFVSMADLRSTTTGTSAITGTCTASQTLTWNSGSDNLQCQSISIAAATQITGVLPVANGGTGVNSTSQNFIFAGPTSGSGAPSFRALTSADLPSSASYWQAATGGIDYAGGNVGVGTTNPGAKLHVAGEVLANTKVSIGTSGYADLNVVSNGTIYQNGGDAFTRIQSTGAGNARVQLQSNGPSGSSTAANHEAGRIDFGGRGGSAWVDQAASIKGVAETLWSASTNPMALTFSTTTGTTIGERMRISGNGNVGIGTNNPSAKLEVVGASGSTVKIVDGNQAAGRVLTSDANGVASWAAPSGGSSVWSTNGTTAYYNAGSVAIGTTSTMGDAKLQLEVAQDNYLKMASAGTNYVTLGRTDSGGSLLSLFTGGNERIRLDSRASNNSFVNAGGNFGVGTASPDTKLHVVGTTGTTLKIVDGNQAAGRVLTSDAAGVASWAALPASSTLSGTANYIAKFTSASTAGNSLLYDDGSNVGLGTTSPSEKLHVAGNIRATGNFVAEENSGMQFSSGSARIRGSSFDNNIVLETSGNLALVVDANGRVGIGTNNPSEQMDVRAPSAGYVAGFSDGTQTLNFFTGSGYAAVGSKAGHLRLYSDDDVDNGITIETSGKVGIGTSAPSSAFHVVRSGYELARFKNSATSGDRSALFELENGNATPSRWSFTVGGTGNGASITNGEFYFEKYGLGAVMTLDGTGKVGIGTTVPGEKLEVAGNVKATAFISTSDRRLKTDIRAIEGLDLVNRMHGVRYKWKADGKADVGVIAQEMEEVLPEAVVTDAKTGFKAVKYQNLISPLIEAVKELFGLVKAEESKNEAQARELASLKAEVTNLREQNERLRENEKAFAKRLLEIEKKLEKK